MCVCIHGLYLFMGSISCLGKSLWVAAFESIHPQHIQWLKCVLNNLRCIVGFGNCPVEQLDGDALYFTTSIVTEVRL